jgi:hypothetical protein
VQLYALAEATTPEGEGLCRWALATVQRHFGQQGRASLTSAMAGALRGCHEELFKANQEAPQASQAGLGITCLALRGEEVYVARAGPGVVYLYDGQDAQQIASGTPVSPGSRSQGAESAHAPVIVGLTPGEIPVQLHRHALRRGHALLATSSSFARLVNMEGLRAILSSSHREAINKLFLLNKEESLFAALLLTFGTG